MFYKSNSILIGFDASAFNADVDNFNFLNLIQSFSFDVNLKNSNQKFLGGSETIRDQYTNPEVNFNLSYIQRVDFLNEFIFGFNIYSNESARANIAKKFEQGFLNQNAFVLLDSNSNDLISKITDIEKYEADLKVMSFGRVFLNSYSVNYSVGNLPKVSASFSSFNTSTSNIEARNVLKNGDNSILAYGFRNWQDSFYELPLSKAKDLISNLNANIDQTIVYQMRNFSIETDYASESLIAPNLNFKTLLDGVIQSLDLNLDFNRNKFYFFDREFSDSNFIYPIKGSLKISGISSDLTNSDLKNIFEKNKLFKIKISLGINEEGKDYYELFLEKLSISSFSFSVDINGMLNYNLDCYFEINETSGVFIKQVNKVYNSKIKIDSDFLVSQDGDSISVFPENSFKQLPQINQNLPNVFTIPNLCSTKKYLTICACDPNSDPLIYSWYCNGKLILNETGNSLAFYNATCNTMGFYNAVVKNCNLQTIKSSMSSVLVSGNPLILTDSFCCKFRYGIDIDLYANALGDGEICYFWYNGTGVLQGSGRNFKICCFSNQQTGIYYYKAANIGYESCSDFYCFSLSSSPIALSSPFLIGSSEPIIESCNYFCLGISGENACTFIWRKNGNVISDTLPNFPTKYSGTCTSGLYVNKPTYLDNGFYDAILINDEDSIVSNGFQLSVKSKPIFSNTVLTCLNIDFGSFLCLTSDLINEDVNTSYCWIFNNETIKSGISNSYCSKIATNLNEGSYYLVANNCYGSARKEYFVKINSSPMLSFTSSLECLAPLYSDVCFFSCIIGSPPITYKWFFSPNCTNFYPLDLKEQVENLCIDTVLSNNMGWYYLEATNQNGKICTPLFNLCIESFALPDLRPTVSAANPNPSYTVDIINITSINTIEQETTSTSQGTFNIPQSLLDSLPQFSAEPISSIPRDSIADQLAELVSKYNQLTADQQKNNATALAEQQSKFEELTTEQQKNLRILQAQFLQLQSTQDQSLQNQFLQLQSNQTEYLKTIVNNLNNATTSVLTNSQTNNSSSSTTLTTQSTTTPIPQLSFGRACAQGEVVKVCNKSDFKLYYTYNVENPCIIFCKDNTEIYNSLNQAIKIRNSYVTTASKEFTYEKEKIDLSDAGIYTICICNGSNSISRYIRLEIFPSQPVINCIYLNSKSCVDDFYSFISTNSSFRSSNNVNNLCDKNEISYCWLKKDDDSETPKSSNDSLVLNNLTSSDSGCYIFCILNGRTDEYASCEFILRTVEGPYFAGQPQDTRVDFANWSTEFPTFSACSFGTKPISYIWEYCLENGAIQSLNTSYFNCTDTCNTINSAGCSKSEISGKSGIFYTLNGVVSKESVTDEQKKCKWYFRVSASNPYGSGVSSWATLNFSSDPAKVTSISTDPIASPQTICKNCRIKINAYVDGVTPICWFVKGVYFRPDNINACKATENGVTINSLDACISVHPSFLLNNTNVGDILSNGAIYCNSSCTSGNFRYFYSTSNELTIEIPMEYAGGRILDNNTYRNPLSAIFYIGVKNKYNSNWCCSVSFSPNTTSQYSVENDTIINWAKRHLDPSSLCVLACNSNLITTNPGASSKTYFGIITSPTIKEKFCIHPDFTGNYCWFGLFGSSNLTDDFKSCQLISDLNSCCIELPYVRSNSLIAMKFIAKNSKCTFYGITNYFCRILPGVNFLFTKPNDNKEYSYLSTSASSQIICNIVECNPTTIFLCSNNSSSQNYTNCTIWQKVNFPESLNDYEGCWAKYDSSSSSWVDIEGSSQDSYELKNTYLNSGCYRRVFKHKCSVNPNNIWPNNDQSQSNASGLIFQVNIAPKIDLCIKYAERNDAVFLCNSEIYFTGEGTAGVSKHCWSYFIGNFTQLSTPIFIGCYSVENISGKYITTGKLNLSSLSFAGSSSLNLLAKACIDTAVNELKQSIDKTAVICVVNPIRTEGIIVVEKPKITDELQKYYGNSLENLNKVLKEKNINTLPQSIDLIYSSEGLSEFTRTKSNLTDQININGKFPDGNVVFSFGLTDNNVTELGITDYGWFVQSSSAGYIAPKQCFKAEIDVSPGSWYCMYPCWVYLGTTYTGSHVCYKTKSDPTIFTYFSVGSNSKQFPNLNAGGEVIAENGFYWGFAFVAGNINNFYDIKFNKVPNDIPDGDRKFICDCYKNTFTFKPNINANAAPPFTPFFFKFDNVKKAHEGDYCLTINEYCISNNTLLYPKEYHVVNNIKVCPNLMLCAASNADSQTSIEYYINESKLLANIDVISPKRTCSLLVEEGNLCLGFRAAGIRNNDNPLSGAIVFCKGASTGFIPQDYFQKNKIDCITTENSSDPVCFIARIKPECVKYNCFNNICLFPYVASTLSNVICTGKSYVHICCISEKLEDISIFLYQKTANINKTVTQYYTIYTEEGEPKTEEYDASVSVENYEPVLESRTNAGHTAFYELNKCFRLSGNFSYSDSSSLSDLTFQWFCQCMIGTSPPVCIAKATSKWLDLPIYNLCCLNKNYFLCICNTRYPNIIGKTGVTCCLSISGINNVDIVIYKGTSTNKSTTSTPSFKKEIFDPLKKENLLEGSLGYFYLSFETLGGTPLAPVKGTCLYLDSGAATCCDLTPYLKNAETLKQEKFITGYVQCKCNLLQKQHGRSPDDPQIIALGQFLSIIKQKADTYWTEDVPLYDETKAWIWSQIPYAPVALKAADDEKSFFLNAYIPSSQDLNSCKIFIRKPIAQVSVYGQLKYIDGSSKQVANTNGQIILPNSHCTSGYLTNSYLSVNNPICFINRGLDFSNCACVLYRIQACNETGNVDFCLCSCYFKHEYDLGNLIKITPCSRLIKVDNTDDPISLIKIANQNDPNVVCALIKFKNISGANFSNPRKTSVDIYSGNHCLIASNCCFKSVNSIVSAAFQTVPLISPIFQSVSCPSRIFDEIVVDCYYPTFINKIYFDNDLDYTHCDYDCMPKKMFLTCTQCVNLCFNICASKEISCDAPLTCRWVVCYQTDKNKIYSGVVSSATSNAYLVKYPPQGLATADYVVGPVKYCACVSNSFAQIESSPICIFYRCDKIRLCCTQIAYPTGNSHTNPDYENIQCVNSNPCQIISVNKGQLVCLRTCIYTGFTPYNFWLYCGTNKNEPLPSAINPIFQKTESNKSLKSSVECIINTTLFSSNETCISLTGYNAHYDYGICLKDSNSVFGNENLLIINLKTNPSFLKSSELSCNVIYGCCLELSACDAVFPNFSNPQNNNSKCCFIWRSGYGLTSSNIVAQGNLCTGLVINPFNCVDMPTNCVYSVTYELCWTGSNNTIDCRSATRYFLLNEGVAAYGVNNNPTWVQKNSIAGSCVSCIWVLDGSENSIHSSCNMFLLPGNYEIFAWGAGGGGSTRRTKQNDLYAGGGAGGFVSGKFPVSEASKCLCIVSLIGIGGEYGGYIENTTNVSIAPTTIRPTPLKSDSFHCIELAGTASSTTRQCFNSIVCSRRGMSGPIETDGSPSVRCDFLLNTYKASSEALTMQDQYAAFQKNKRFYYHPCQVVCLRGSTVYKDCATVLTSISKATLNTVKNQEKYSDNSYLLFAPAIESDTNSVTSIHDKDVNSNINLNNILKNNFQIASCLGTKTSQCKWAFTLAECNVTKYNSLATKTDACFCKCGIDYLFYYTEPKCYNDCSDLLRPRTNLRVAGGAGGGATAVVLAIPSRCVSGILVAGGGGGAGGAVSKSTHNNSCFGSAGQNGKSGPPFAINWSNSLLCGLYAGGDSESCFNGGGGWSSSVCSTSTGPLFEGYGGYGGCTCVSGSTTRSNINFFCAIEECSWNCGRNDNSNATIASYLCFYIGSSQMAINNIPDEVQLKGGIPSNCISSSGNMYNYFRRLIGFGGAGPYNGYDGGIIIVKL
jgi:hypothetical protein